MLLYIIFYTTYFFSQLAYRFSMEEKRRIFQSKKYFSILVLAIAFVMVLQAGGIL